METTMEVTEEKSSLEPTTTTATPAAIDGLWVGFDFDGTLVTYDAAKFNEIGADYIGEPINRMVNLAKKYIAEGINVKIVTARVADKRDIKSIQQQTTLLLDWCKQQGLNITEVTANKDYLMLMLYDDRAVEVFTNTGGMWIDHLNYIVEPLDTLSQADLTDARNYIRLCVGNKGLKTILEVTNRVLNIYGYTANRLTKDDKLNCMRQTVDVVDKLSDDKK